MAAFFDIITNATLAELPADDADLDLAVAGEVFFRIVVWSLHTGTGRKKTILKVGLDGTYSVNSNGTGTIQFMLTLPDGTTSDIIEGFVITKSENRDGTLIATSIFEAQEQPSVVISGDVFVSHVDTRRPD